MMGTLFVYNSAVRGGFDCIIFGKGFKSNIYFLA